MKFLGKLIKVLFGLGALAAVVGVVFMTNTLSEHRGPVKSMRMDVSKAVRYPSTELIDLGSVKLSISDIKTESLNVKSDEIKEGDDYNVYYTLNIENNSTGEAKYVEDGFGYISSETYQYKSYPAEKDVDYSLTTIESGQSYSFKFKIKTDEPLSKIGFIVPYDLHPNNELVFLAFK